MNKHMTTVPLTEKRLLSVLEASEYIGLGRGATRILLEDWGALRKIGGRVLFDRKIIDEHLDAIAVRREGPAC